MAPMVLKMEDSLKIAMLWVESEVFNHQISSNIKTMISPYNFSNPLFDGPWD
jgi:hypothetical protein